ncbi:AvrD family protein [Parapedobacter sp. DT-150]|uniref:AvrD family protein n=1 Tax=Parapedobacter sp. DT-150 TaxID=3396162 RepID=UPI003F1CE82A
MMQTFRDASDFLGSGDGRYFTNGYRHFHWQVTAFRHADMELSGGLRIHYDGPPRPEGPPHLGSMEYTAIASMLTEYALVYLGGLDAEQLSLSLLRRIRLKLRGSVEFTGAITLPFHCTLGGPQWTFHASNGILSPVKVVLGGVEVAAVADHPARRRVGLDPGIIWPLNRRAMYNHGYKLRTNGISDIRCDTAGRTCTARIARADDWCDDRQGLFSARPATIPTDVLSITGQLMQILLYTLEGTTREDCANIWLRAMDIRYGRPVWDGRYEAGVRFLDFRTVRMGSAHWRAVELESRMAGVSGTFSITHRLKS